jgi:Interleukin-like EMT inducer
VWRFWGIEFITLIAGGCNIELKASSYYDKVWESYVSIIGGEKRLGDTGVNVAVLDRSTCFITDFKTFNTWNTPSSSDQLAAYIMNLQDGTVLLGFSHYEASTQLTTVTIQALMDVGVNLLDFKWGQKFVFGTVVGSPQSAVFEVQTGGGENLVANFTVGPDSLKGM